MGSRVVVRREAGLWAYERALARAGLAPVAGADEAGRGACAGPLVVAAAVLPAGRRGEIAELADSKLLTPAARDRVYDQVLAGADAVSVVVIPADQVDRGGLHQCNLAGMRRALAALTTRPGYVLTDGFPVAGLGIPGLGVWKGDRVAACIAAASVVAKVTRDRIMGDLHERYPSYGFDEHKGYVTPEHRDALAQHGPCDEHRFSYQNVLARTPELAGLRLARLADDRIAGSRWAAGQRAAGQRAASQPAAGRRGNNSREACTILYGADPCASLVPSGPRDNDLTRGTA